MKPFSRSHLFLGGLFGSTNNNTSTFGNNNNNNSFSFGNNNNANKPSTGFSFGNTNTNTSSGFSFGNTNNNTANKPSTGFSFGNTNNNTNTSTGFSFGNNNNTNKPSTGFSFGNTTTTNTFGSTPSTGFSFGNTQNNNSITNNPLQTQPQQQPSATNILSANLQPQTTPEMGLAAQKAVDLQNKTMQSLLDAPYGDSSLLRLPKDVIDKIQKDHDKKVTAPTDPNAQKAILEKAVKTTGSNFQSLYKMPKSVSLNFTSASPKMTSSKSSNKLSPKKAKKVSLFDDLDDDKNEKKSVKDIKPVTANSPFLLNRQTNVKQLNVKLINSTAHNESLLARTINDTSHLNSVRSGSISPICDNESVHSSVAFEPAAIIQNSTRADCTDNDAGIVCKNFTLEPSIRKINQNYDPETKSCIVNNLKVIRKDYGFVQFLGETNVAGLNFDEIIFIRRKEVVVYPDEVKKPAEGLELNKPAIVCLEATYPKNKQKPGSVITDLETLREMDWAGKLRKSTKKIGATFIEFIPENGSWVFEVEHFSRYALDESDSEEESADEFYEAIASIRTSTMQKKKPTAHKTGAVIDHQALKPTKVFEKSYQNAGLGFQAPSAHKNIFEDRLDEFNSESDQEEFIFTKPDKPLNVSNNTSLFKDTSKVPGMKIALFESDSENMDSEDDALAYENSELNYPKVTRESLSIESRMTKMPDSILTERPVVEIPKEKEETPKLTIPRPVLIQPFKNLNLVNRLKKLKNVPVKFSPTRVSFSANGNYTVCNPGIAAGTVTIFKVNLKKPKFAHQIYKDTKRNPEEKVDTQVFQTIPEVLDTVKERDTKKFHHLIHALFGKLTEREHFFLEGAKQGVTLDLIRKRRLNQYMRKFLAAKSTETSDIVKFMLTGKFQSACNACQKQNQPMLASCIAKIFLNGLCSIEINNFKSQIAEQVLNWRETKADQSIDKDTLKCYTLLAGFRQFELSNEKIIDNVSDANWLELFARHAWFFCEAETDIKGILEAFKNTREEITLPRSSPDRDWDESRSSPCYLLIEFFCDPDLLTLNKVIDPLNFSDNFDNVESSWHAWRQLAGTEDLNSFMVDEHIRDKLMVFMASKLHSNYGEMLSKNDKVVEAVQVFQYREFLLI